MGTTRRSGTGEGPATASMARLLARLPLVSYVAAPEPGLPLRFVSDNAEAILGISPQDCVAAGHPLAADAPGRKAGRSGPAWERLWSAGLTEELFEWTAPDGRRIWVRDRLELVRDAAGQAVEVVGSWQDVTELEQAHRILERTTLQAAEMARRADEATRYKSEFLASMSHEIRTPMNGIIGMAELLAEEELPDRQRECVEIISSSADVLLGLINDILDLSKIEAGRMDLDLHDFDLAAVAEEAVRLVAPKAEAKRLALDLSIGRAVPRMVRGDASRLRQVLLNLLTNAVKFTEEGSVSLGVECFERAETGFGLRLSVRDTGIGISPEAQSKLFRAFSQADRSTSRRYGGTGLGLAISKRIVEMMEGSISVQSEPGRGSTFAVELHLAGPRGECPGDSAAATKLQDAVRSGGRTQPKVMVVDDNPVNQRVAAHMLGKLGVHCDVAVGGGQALSALEAGEYDLLFTDIEMPDMDGYELTRRVRELSGRVSSIPVVAMTAHAVKGAREECLQAGMDDYVSKPVQLASMRDVVDRWLAQPRGTLPNS